MEEESKLLLTKYDSIQKTWTNDQHGREEHFTSPDLRHAGRTRGRQDNPLGPTRLANTLAVSIRAVQHIY
ncbi:uncharacterized protein N7482_006468 [Penicillium canariense]|uniref:Uncharacterized protein n=1 Tax=Penicillium canariense TaxID=189055 RepID=A0A9W9HUL6_9EURO|nr:uncharacterized protein N7482_006468 [Penicillium canariense]KAJ5159464.1 hypothetical protein N7482_006468 [Penicillium canariense]